MTEEKIGETIDETGEVIDEIEGILEITKETAEIEEGISVTTETVIRLVLPPEVNHLEEVEEVTAGVGEAEVEGQLHQSPVAQVMCGKIKWRTGLIKNSSMDMMARRTSPGNRSKFY